VVDNRRGEACAFAYWEDDDSDEDSDPICAGPFCGCEAEKAPYGGGAGACGGPCDSWIIRGRQDHRKDPGRPKCYVPSDRYEDPICASSGSCQHIYCVFCEDPE
jgi:hypothetical protein